MCNELISVGFCAETGTNSLTPTCGKYHSFAGKREVCPKAKGPCVCYFGTCGDVKKFYSKELVNMYTVPHLRCGLCNAREEAKSGERSHGLKIIDNPRVSREVVHEEYYPQHLANLRRIWGAESCPYHTSESNDSNTEKEDWALYELVPWIDIPWCDTPLGTALAGKQIGAQMRLMAFRGRSNRKVDPIYEDKDFLREEKQLTKENLARIAGKFDTERICMAAEVKLDQMRNPMTLNETHKANAQRNDEQILIAVAESDNNEANIATAPESNSDPDSNKGNTGRIPLIPDHIKAWLAGHN